MISEAVSTEDLLFPKFEYHLDDSDCDIAVLRSQDDAFVAAFSARGATAEGIVEAAKEAYVNYSGPIRPGEARPLRNTGALKTPTQDLFT
jgi:hypothetical protein